MSLVDTRAIKIELSEHSPCLKENKGDSPKHQKLMQDASVRINLVPHSGRKNDELVGKVLHLPQPGTEVAHLLACIIDVVDQGLVVSLKLLRILVLMLVNVWLDAQDQVGRLLLQGDSLTHA